MPIIGRRPGGPGVSDNRHRPRHDWVEIENAPFTGGPRLPAKRSGGQPWPAWTRRKWNCWRRMPHCVLWDEADWAFAMDTIEIHARFCDGANVAAELRVRESVMGTTTRDSLRGLGIRYVAPRAQPLAAVIKADDYRGL